MSFRLPWPTKKAPVVPRSPGEAADIELASGIAEGDRRALAALVDRHAGPLHKYLLRRLGPGNEALAAEITASTFDDAFRHLEQYAQGRARTPMSHWLIRLANRRLARRQSSTRVVTARSSAESPELARLRRVLTDMPARHQAALALSLYEGMSPPDIAGALGVRQATAMRWVREALKRAGHELRAEPEKPSEHV